MKNCLLVAGGAVSAPLLKKIAREGDFAYVFAVDRGLEALDACGIRPTHLVGDFDSVKPEVLERYLPGREPNGKTGHGGGSGTQAVGKAGQITGSKPSQTVRDSTEPVGKGLPELERLIPEKDDTDTEHAMRRAVSLRPEEIVLMGGFGTRFDHVLANVHTLTIPLRAGIRASMVDETNRVRLLGGADVKAGRGNCVDETDRVRLPGADDPEYNSRGETALLRIKKRDAWGKYISLLPLTAEVTGITLEGFQYPLTDAVFKIGETVSLGVSNELAAEEGVIRVKNGVLAVIESKD